MVHSGYRPLRIVFGWCTVDIVLLGQCLDGAQWISSSYDSVWMVHSGYRSSQDSVWMVHSGYRPLRIVFGWCTVDIVLLGQCLDGAQWISWISSQDSVWMVHSGYRPLRIVFGWCTVDIVLLGQCLDGAQWISSSVGQWIRPIRMVVHSGYRPHYDSVWMVHSGYRPLRIVFGWCTVDIVLLWDSVWMVHSGYRSLRIVYGWCTVDIVLRIVFGWCTVDIVLLGQCLDGAQWISSSQDSVWMVHWISQDSVWMVHSGYRPLRIVFGWCTVDIVLL